MSAHTQMTHKNDISWAHSVAISETPRRWNLSQYHGIVEESI